MCTEKIEEKWYGENDDEDECTQLKEINIKDLHEHETDYENQSSTNSAQQISNLRSRSKHISTQINVTEIIGSEEHECAICFAPYEEGDVICFSQNQHCPHFYHVECMVSWLSRNDNYSCPSCRQDYLKNDDSTDSDDSKIVVIESPDVNSTSHSSSTHSSNSDLVNLDQGDDGEIDSSIIIHSDEEYGENLEQGGDDDSTTNTRDNNIAVPNGDQENTVDGDEVIDINHVLRYG